MEIDFERRLRQHPHGAMYELIQVINFFCNCIQCQLRTLRCSNILLNQMDSGTKTFDALCRLGRCLAVRHVIEKNVGAWFGKPTGYFEPYAFGSASDEYGHDQGLL